MTSLQDSGVVETWMENMPFSGFRPALCDRHPFIRWQLENCLLHHLKEFAWDDNRKLDRIPNGSGYDQAKLDTHQSVDLSAGSIAMPSDFRSSIPAVEADHSAKTGNTAVTKPFERLPISLILVVNAYFTLVFSSWFGDAFVINLIGSAGYWLVTCLVLRRASALTLIDRLYLGFGQFGCLKLSLSLYEMLRLHGIAAPRG